MFTHTNMKNSKLLITRFWQSVYSSTVRGLRLVKTKQLTERFFLLKIRCLSLSSICVMINLISLYCLVLEMAAYYHDDYCIGDLVQVMFQSRTSNFLKMQVNPNLLFHLHQNWYISNGWNDLPHPLSTYSQY